MFGLGGGLLTVALACLARPQVSAADGPENEVLKKHGLKIAGSLAVADEEAEIKTKLTDARRLSKQLSYSLMQQQGTLSPEEQQKTVKTLGTEINQLRSEMNAVNQQMNQVPRNNNPRYGRFGGGMSFANNDAAEMYARARRLSQSAPGGAQSRFVFSQPAQEPAGRPQGEGENRLRGPRSARRLSSGTS